MSSQYPHDQLAHNQLAYGQLEKNIDFLIQKYRKNKPGLQEEDLRQEAEMTLIRIAELYDPSRGARFQTFATQCIKNHFKTIVKKRQAATPNSEYADNLGNSATPPRYGGHGEHGEQGEYGEYDGCGEFCWDTFLQKIQPYLNPLEESVLLQLITPPSDADADAEAPPPGYGVKQHFVKQHFVKRKTDKEIIEHLGISRYLFTKCCEKIKQTIRELY